MEYLWGEKMESSKAGRLELRIFAPKIMVRNGLYWASFGRFPDFQLGFTSTPALKVRTMAERLVACYQANHISNFSNNANVSNNPILQ